MKETGCREGGGACRVLEGGECCLRQVVGSPIPLLRWSVKTTAVALEDTGVEWRWSLVGGVWCLTWREASGARRSLSEMFEIQNSNCPFGQSVGIGTPCLSIMRADP